MSDSGTTQTTGDSNRVTRSMKWFVAALVVAALLGLVAVLTLELTAWRDPGGKRHGQGHSARY